jgi:hypothetical protein
MAKYRSGQSFSHSIELSLIGTKALLELHQSDSDFLPKFIAFFDQEKDPRNLMLVFSILTVVMTEWDISSVAQVRLPGFMPGQLSNADAFIGSVRCCFQLLPNHIPASSG